MQFLQKLGKSLMLPVAVLPICAVLMGVGYSLCPEAMQGGNIEGFIPSIGYLLTQTGGAIINNMAWLFVIGVSVGMSDDQNGAVCLAGLVSWLVVITLLSPTVIDILPGDVLQTPSIILAFENIQNPFIAILCGLLAATCYNKFKDTTLPEKFAFFSGRRFVVIIVAVFSIALTLVLAIAWPLAYAALLEFGEWILGLGGIGAGIYAFLNRLLIPFGLHHALNNIFWFDTVGIGDLTHFWAGDVAADVGWDLGMYMSGFFPCIMFGIPGAVAAMVKNAKSSSGFKIKGILTSAAVCAFLCGVTEPFEFMFVYVAFPLYVVYSLLYGVFAIIVYYVGFRAGFSFSAGAVDLLFSSSMPAASNTWLIIVLGIAAFVVFFLVFDVLIRCCNFKTPGRQDDDENSILPVPTAKNRDMQEGRKKNSAQAAKLIEALGGSSNIVSLDCCATRLRLELKENAQVDRALCKAAGALGIVAPSEHSCQVIIGVTVQQVCESMKKLLAQTPATADDSTPAEALAQKENPNLESPDATAEALQACAPMQNASASIESNLFGKRVAHTDVVVKPAVRFKVTDPVGLHARPASGVVKIAKEYQSSIVIEAHGKKANATSVIELMSLGISFGDTLTIKASGEDAEPAMLALMKYLKENL